MVHEELLARLPEPRAAMFVCKVQCSDGHTCIAYVAAEHVGADQLQPLHGHTQGDDWVQTTCCEEQIKTLFYLLRYYTLQTWITLVFISMHVQLNLVLG